MPDLTDTASDAKKDVQIKRETIRIVGACLFSVAAFFLLYSRDYYISAQCSVLIALTLTVFSYATAEATGGERLYFRLGLAGVGLAVLLACLPLTHCTWSLADDYVIPMMLGGAGRMRLGELIAHLGVTESCGVVFGNTSGRFQPVFVFMYAVNTFLFGNHIQFWYMFYGAMFLASVLLTLLALRRFFDGVTAVLAGCVVFAHLKWYWLFRDTGVVEVYGLLGLSLTAWLIARNRARSVVSMGTCFLVTLGGFLMIGTKETLAPAALLPLGFFVSRCFASDVRERRKALAWVVVNLAVCLYVFLGIGATLAAAGDAEGLPTEQTAFWSDIAAYLRDFGQRIAWPWYAAALAALAGANLLPRRKNGPGAAGTRQTLVCLGVAAFLFLFGLSQYVFYQGGIDNQHYAIPFSAIPALLWLTLGWLFLRTAARRFPGRAHLAARMLLGLLCCINVLATPSFAKDIIRIFGEKNAAYVATLEKIAATVAREPDRPLVLVVGDTQNDELAVSPAVYLKEVFHIPNAIYVRPTTHAAPIERLRDNGYGDSITPGNAPDGAAAFTAGILTTPEGTTGNLGRILPVPVAEPQLKLLPLVSRDIW